MKGTRLMARILLAEDDADVLVVVEHVLLQGGYGVDTARNLEEAHELLLSRDYDLVVTDGRLPDGTGMELADAAREKSIPSLILTGYAFILRELAADPTKYRVLLKPLRPVEIIQAVKDTLRSPSITD
ncbi:MAG TPA: response regulator [Stellaceae bacterium]|nr:response regulator [Stellaceae bacterium]